MPVGGRSELRQFFGDVEMRSFLRVYLSESRRRLADMSRALSAGDAGGVREAVHALLPTSRWAGASDVAAICETLHGREDWSALTPEHTRLVAQLIEGHHCWEKEVRAAMPELASGVSRTRPNA